MFRFDVRRVVGALGVALSLLLVSPAAAAERDGRTRNRSHSMASIRTTGVWNTVVLALRQAGAASPFGVLVSAWLGEGHLIDPNGVVTVPLPDPHDGGGSSSSGSTDEGHLIDPNG